MLVMSARGCLKAGTRTNILSTAISASKSQLKRTSLNNSFLLAHMTLRASAVIHASSTTYLKLPCQTLMNSTASLASMLSLKAATRTTPVTMAEASLATVATLKAMVATVTLAMAKAKEMSTKATTMAAAKAKVAMGMSIKMIDTTRAVVAMVGTAASLLATAATVEAMLQAMMVATMAQAMATASNKVAATANAQIAASVQVVATATATVRLVATATVRLVAMATVRLVATATDRKAATAATGQAVNTATTQAVATDAPTVAMAAPRASKMETTTVLATVEAMAAAMDVLAVGTVELSEFSRSFQLVY